MEVNKMITTAGLTNIQQELLKIYSKNIKNEDLENVKIILARYFAKKARVVFCLVG